MSKTDQQLGSEVHNYLVSKGVETPLSQNMLSDEQKRERIEEHFAAIMTTLGLDITDDSLMDTPTRVAKMYVDEIFYGLDYANFPKCTTVDNKMHYDEMVVERNVNVQSNCEHHFVVISGHATVAYIPKNKVLGLSKINRIVEFFAKRPQIQERLTEQVYYALEYILETENVAVLMDAEHYCVKSRGIKDVGSSTVTSKLGGSFRFPEVRAEFFGIATKGRP
jgi:GTP cyclohydrolase I